MVVANTAPRQEVPERVSFGASYWGLGPSKPVLPDRGLSNDVMARISQADYAVFHRCIVDAAMLAREAFDAEDAYTASKKWQDLFGNEFPLAPKPEAKVAFTARAGAVTTLSEANFA